MNARDRIMDTVRTEPELFHAEDDAALRACWPAMTVLRPALGDPEAFVAACRRMRPEGYRVLAAREDGAVLALAGYRIQENLVFGRFLYVDDLVTLEAARGRRLGARLLAALKEIAFEADCARLVLDTGLSNGRAQRFYFREGLLPLALRFAAAAARP